MTAPLPASGAAGLSPASGAGGLGPASLGWSSVRMAAAAAALAVAVAGRGDLLFLGALLAVALAERRSSIAALLAVAAVAVRWGTTSLDTITGAITTLGPGVRVGPPHAAAALAVAGAGLLLAGVGAPLLPRLAAAATAGTVALGPVGAASAGAVAFGLAAVACAVAVAVLAPRWVPEPSERLRRAAPGVAGFALALAIIW